MRATSLARSVFGVLLVSSLASLAGTGVPARAALPPTFELLPAAQATALPPELRFPTSDGDFPVGPRRRSGAALRHQPGEPATGVAAPTWPWPSARHLTAPTARHTVHLRWVVREHQAPLGYRVTLAAAAGLPGHLAARWWIPAIDGVPVADGLIAYDAQLVLRLDHPAWVAAAVETIAPNGAAQVLGVQPALTAARPAPTRAFGSPPPALAWRSSLGLSPGVGRSLRTPAALPATSRSASACGGLQPLRQPNAPVTDASLGTVFARGPPNPLRPSAADAHHV